MAADVYLLHTPSYNTCTVAARVELSLSSGGGGISHYRTLSQYSRSVGL